MENINMKKLGLGGAHYFSDTTNPKFEEIKKLLDDKGLKEKMEGMKRLIALMSKGRDVSVLYPDVVKNVVCKNMAVKKLVYMYIVHYAELEPDPALLAINNFQRDMTSENQLTRALGLRVMSSIRLRMIGQVLLIALKKGCKDSSPYVRKAAAHAVSKVYNLDQEVLPELTDVLEILLGDNSPMVIGSAYAAFNEVCPTRYEMLHKHFRKTCHMLADVEEWGQQMIVHVFTRYARHEFLNPERPQDKEKREKKKKDIFEGEKSGSEGEESESEDDLFGDTVEMDPDHRLLLTSLQPLLRSSNASVVLETAIAYFYLAPSVEAQQVGKPLIRLIRGEREIQYVALSNIATMARTRANMFEPYVLEFFIYMSDSAFVRQKKLEILTFIANGGNINTILDEMNDYVHRDDPELVTAAIQTIGRCASRLPEVTDTVMRTLMRLISSSSQSVVAESIIVIKKLLQTGKTEDFPLADVVTQLAKLLDNVKNADARASIIWTIGEYSESVRLRAPDVLRKLAKSFKEEEPLVKLQILNLGAKLALSNPEQTKLLLQYVLDLARFDMSYDIRDRARVMRAILLSENASSVLHAHAKELFSSKKPVPKLEVDLIDADTPQLALGTLSHLVNHKVPGYDPLPDFPLEAPKSDRTPKDAYLQAPTTPSPLDLNGPDDEGSDDSFGDGTWSPHTSDEEDQSEYSDEEGERRGGERGGKPPQRGQGSDRSYSSGSSRSGSSYSDSYSSDEEDHYSNSSSSSRSGKGDARAPITTSSSTPQKSVPVSVLDAAFSTTVPSVVPTVQEITTTNINNGEVEDSKEIKSEGAGEGAAEGSAVGGSVPNGTTENLQQQQESVSTETPQEVPNQVG